MSKQTKTITETEFRKLLAQDGWKREYDHDMEHDERPYFIYDEEWLDTTYGTAWVVSTLGDIEITSVESYHYEDYEEDTLETESGVPNGQLPIEINGVSVVADDDEYDELDSDELMEVLEDVDSDFIHPDYSFLEIHFNQTNDIDFNEDSDMETFVLTNDNAPNLRFNGELVASAANSPNRASSSWSGAVGQWSELALYKTKADNYVCERVERTTWANGKDTHRIHVSPDRKGVIAFFGYSDLAKELYGEANISHEVDADQLASEVTEKENAGPSM